MMTNSLVQDKANLSDAALLSIDFFRSRHQVRQYSFFRIDVVLEKILKLESCYQNDKNVVINQSSNELPESFKLKSGSKRKMTFSF